MTLRCLAGFRLRRPEGERTVSSSHFSFGTFSTVKQLVLALVATITLGLTPTASFAAAPSVKPTATGGTPLGPGTATAVVVAKVIDGDYRINPGTCTGVLLEPRIVATATHCILDRNTDRPKDLLEYYVVGPGSDFSEDHFQWSVLVDEVLLGPFKWANVPTPWYAASSVPADANWANDFALMVLAEPLPVREPVRIASREEIDTLVQSSAPMVSIGYGTGRTPDVLLQPLAVPRAVRPAGQGDAFGDFARSVEIVLTEGATTDDVLCPGDSGGPLLARDDGGWVLVGLTVAINYNNTCASSFDAQVSGNWAYHSQADRLLPLMERARQIAARNPVPAGYCEGSILEPPSGIFSLQERDVYTECRKGRVWRGAVCATGKRLILEEYTDGSWQTVRRLSGKRDADCPSDEPFFHRFSRRVPVGSFAEYQVRLPGRPQQDFVGRYFIHGFSRT